MELRQLKQFITIAQSDTLTQAAEKLFISQPALSTSLKNLEAELGVSLFERKKNAMKLNEQGEIALLQAKEIVEKANAMKHYFQQLAQRQSSYHHIAFCDAGPLWFCLPNLSNFSNEIHIQTSKFEPPETGLELLLSGAADMVISAEPFAHHSVISRPFLQDQILISVPNSHPLSAQTSVTLAELAPYEIYQLQVGGAFFPKIHQKLIEQHQQITFETDYFQFRQQLIHSKALSFSSRLAQHYRDDGENRKIIPLTDEVCFMQYHLNYLKSREQALEAVRKVLDG